MEPHKIMAHLTSNPVETTAEDMVRAEDIRFPDGNSPLIDEITDVDRKFVCVKRC